MQLFDVDINKYLDILKGVGAQIVIWAWLPRLQISVAHTKYKHLFDVDINEYLDIIKGVGAQIVI